MIFLYSTLENEEFLAGCWFPNFSSGEIVALVPLNMGGTEKKGREGKLKQTYQKNPLAYHKYSMTKPALQWIIICSNILLLRTESAKGFQAHSVI